MIVITGDSHVAALRKGADLLGSRELADAVGRSIRIGALGNGKHTLAPFCELAASGVTFSRPDYASALRRVSGYSSFQSNPEITYGLCLGLHSAPVFRHPMWRKHARSQLAGKLRKRPVSSSVFEAIVDANSKHTMRLFELLVTAQVNFFVISTPPPRRDHYCMEATLPEVVLDVDRTFRASVRQRLERLGVACVMPPEEVYEESGFLRDDYANKAPSDFHHGNVEYGKALIRSFLLDPAVRPRLLT